MNLRAPQYVGPTRLLLAAVAAALLLPLLAPASAHAVYRYQLPDCSTPRRAADTLFFFLQPARQTEAEWADSDLRTLAATCIEGGSESQELAIQVKAIFDARGLYVSIQSLPDRADYADDDGDELVVLHPQLPQIYLVRGEDDLWRYAAYSMVQVPQLYAESYSPLEGWLKSVIPSSLERRIWGLALWQWLALPLLLAIAALVSRLLSAILVGILGRFSRLRGVRLDRTAVAKTHRPFTLLVGALLVLSTYADLRLGVTINNLLVLLLNVGISVSAVWIVVAWSDVAVSWLDETIMGTQHRAIVPLVRRALHVVVVALGIVFVLQRAGYDVGTLVAGLGIGGLAVALAAQDTLRNLFASMTLFLDKPFEVGHWIKAGNVEGVVEQIGFRSTRVRTFYSSLVTIPNSKMADGTIDNLGVRQYRRFKVMLSLTYDTPPDRVQAYVEGVRATLKAHPTVRQDYYEVHLNGMTATSLDVLVYAFFDTDSWTDELKGRSNLIMEFLRLAEELEVGFAFPTQTIHVEGLPDQSSDTTRNWSAPELASVVESFGPGGSRSMPAGPVISQGFEAHEPVIRGSSGDE